MEEPDGVVCAACKTKFLRSTTKSILDPLDEETTTTPLHVLKFSAGLTLHDGSVCERCYELIVRLHEADVKWRLLRTELIDVCNGTLPLNNSRTHTKQEPFVENIKVEEFDIPVSPSSPPRLPTPTNFSDSDDEPLYKTKLNSLIDGKQPNDVIKSEILSAGTVEQYSCRECNETFSTKSTAAIHVFSLHRIDPAKDTTVILRNFSDDSKKLKDKRKLKKRCSTNEISSKKIKNKKLDSKKFKEVPITNPELIKTASQLQQRLAIPNLTIKKVPNSTHTLQSELSGQSNRQDKLIISGTTDSNTILNQLQTAGLQVTSNIGTKKLISVKRDKIKERFPCKECSAVLSSKSRYDLHMAKHHGNKTPYICEICGAAYKHKKACDIHVGMHKGISPWKCNECSKIFPSKGALSRHEAIHTGTPNYQCDLCGKSFIHTSSFKMHKLSHSGVKPHSCSKCGLALMTKSHLKRHQRVHSGEKRHECNVCGKKFSERYNLYAHQKSHDYNSVHRVGKNHNCTLCEATFIRRHLLDKHMEAVHQLVSENKVKQPRNTMNKLLKQQQTLSTSLDSSEVKPDVTLSEVQPKLSPVMSHANTIESNDVKGEVSFAPVNVKEADPLLERHAETINGESHPWQSLMNYHLANDYPLRMHGVDYVGYLNRQ